MGKYCVILLVLNCRNVGFRWLKLQVGVSSECRGGWFEEIMTVLILCWWSSCFFYLSFAPSYYGSLLLCTKLQFMSFSWRGMVEVFIIIDSFNVFICWWISNFLPRSYKSLLDYRNFLYINFSVEFWILITSCGRHEISIEKDLVKELLFYIIISLCKSFCWY